MQGPLGWFCCCRAQRNVVWNPSRRLQRDDVWHHPCSPGFPRDKIFDVKPLGAKIVHDPQNTNLTQPFCRPNLFGVIIFQAIPFLTNLISLTWIRKLLSIKLRVLYMISPYKPNFILSAPAAPASKCSAGWGVGSKNSKKTYWLQYIRESLLALLVEHEDFKKCGRNWG